MTTAKMEQSIGNGEVLEAASDIYQWGAREYIAIGWKSKKDNPKEADTIVYCNQPNDLIIFNLEQIIHHLKDKSLNKEIVRYKSEGNIITLFPRNEPPKGA